METKSLRACTFWGCIDFIKEGHTCPIRRENDKDVQV